MARQKHAAARARRKNGSSRSIDRSARHRTGPSTLTRARRVMSNAMSDDIAAMRGEVNQLIGDLEDRLNRLNRLTKSGASHAVDGVNDLMYGAVTSLTDPVRNKARAVSNDAAKIGHQALRRIGTEIDQHPLLTLAIAAGIGFIAGMARRTD